MNESLTGFILLHRKFINWHYYKSVNIKSVFLHLLLTANYADSLFKQYTIKRGDLVTSVKSLAKQLNLSEQTIKTALKNLVKTNEIKIRTTNKFTVITVINYNTYQITTFKHLNNKQTNNQTNKQNDNDLTNKINSELFDNYNTYDEPENQTNKQNDEKLTSKLTSKVTTSKRILININNKEKENDLENEFNVIWNLYNKKIGDKKKLMKKYSLLTPDEKQKLLNHIPVYVKSTPDKQYRKNFETYLNNKSFNDEVIIKNNSNLNNNTAVTEKGIIELITKQKGV